MPGESHCSRVQPCTERGSREQREPQSEPPAGSPRHQREELRVGRWGSLLCCLFPESSDPPVCLPCPATCPFSPFLLETSLTALPDVQSPAGGSCPKQALGLQSFFWFDGGEHLSEPLSVGWAPRQHRAWSPFASWHCGHKKPSGFPPHEEGRGVHLCTPGSCGYVPVSLSAVQSQPCAGSYGDGELKCGI